MIKLTARRYEKKRDYEQFFFCVKKSYEIIGKKSLYMLIYNDEMQAFELFRYHNQKSKYYLERLLDPENTEDAEDLRWILNFIELEQLFQQELDKIREQIWEKYYAKAKN